MNSVGTACAEIKSPGGRAKGSIPEAGKNGKWVFCRSNERTALERYRTSGVSTVSRLLPQRPGALRHSREHTRTTGQVGFDNLVHVSDRVQLFCCLEDQ